MQKLVATGLLAALAAVVVADDRSEPVRRTDLTSQEEAAPEHKDAQQTDANDEPIDFVRARELFRRSQRGEKLTADEQAYLQKAIEARRRRAGSSVRPSGRPAIGGETTGLKPLTEMTADDHYKEQDGGLYGQGRNTPPDEHQRAANIQLGEIRPLDKAGKPSDQGHIVLVSISMSNATQEFSRFKQLADADIAKSSKVTIVDCAQGGQAMAEWADPEAAAWERADQRLKAAGVTPQQVQVAWVKLANKSPRGELAVHGKELQQDTQAVLQIAKARFPNLRIAYLSSRIYGGYANSPLNPEPYAYESAYVVRWLIDDQIEGNPELNPDLKRGEVKASLLLWGPYLWADGVTARKNDGLVWNRDDLAGDGTHPSPAGRDKVARMLLDFFANDPLAKPWFVDPAAAKD